MIRFIIGVIDMFELCYPHRAISIWTKLAYTNADDAEPREWFLNVAKFEGLLLILTAVAWPLFQSGTDDEGEALDAEDSVPDDDTDAEGDDNIPISID